MKESEEFALAYLKSLGFTEIVYEPDGNIPPDFLLDGRIAVEVRRLNRNVATSPGNPTGIESAQFQLLNCIRPILKSLGPSKDGLSWFVHYIFSRPIPSASLIRREVTRVLSEFRDGKRGKQEFRVSDNFTIGLIRATNRFPDCFVLGGSLDEDSGGWLVPDLIRNINQCSREKMHKIAAHRAKYPVWWLVLIDHVGYGIREEVSVPHKWDKLILVNPLNSNQGYEVPPADSHQ